MPGFASTTEVPAERTRAEIETVLKKYKATSFSSGWNDCEAFVAFIAHERMIKFKILLPDRKAREITHNGNGRLTERAADARYDQAVRTIWRRLLLCIKAKLESVASQIETFEAAFQAHIVLPGGMTVGEWLSPQIKEAYASKRMPRMLTVGTQPVSPPTVELPSPNVKGGADDD